MYHRTVGLGNRIKPTYLPAKTDFLSIRYPCTQNAPHNQQTNFHLLILKKNPGQLSKYSPPFIAQTIAQN